MGLHSGVALVIFPSSRIESLAFTTGRRSLCQRARCKRAWRRPECTTTSQQCKISLRGKIQGPSFHQAPFARRCNPRYRTKDSYSPISTGPIATTPPPSRRMSCQMFLGSHAKCGNE